MVIHETDIAGVVVVETCRMGDARGSFARWFCEDELKSVTGSRRIVQINHSHTADVGSIRGMHFQKPPHAEMKLIRCIRGRVLDVALDLRKNSQTFLQWHACELSAENDLLIVIPEGCAHGFLVLEPGSELLYLHTHPYTPAAEGGVLFDDPVIGIEWPLPAGRMSNRDRNHPQIDKSFQGLEV